MTATRLYRSVVREVAKASTQRNNKDVSASLRRLFERGGVSGYDAENVVTFVRSQREYKRLLERYNPLIDLVGEERVEATARRVGLKMPVVRDDLE